MFVNIDFLQIKFYVEFDSKTFFAEFYEYFLIFNDFISLFM